MKVVCILKQDNYKPGDQPPEGYLAWKDWAEVQHKSGLRQMQCGKCGLWLYPQELSVQTMRWTAQSRKGPVEQIAPVCNKCAAHNAKVSGAGTASAGLNMRDFPHSERHLGAKIEFSRVQSERGRKSCSILRRLELIWQRKY